MAIRAPRKIGRPGGLAPPDPPMYFFCRGGFAPPDPPFFFGSDRSDRSDRSIGRAVGPIGLLAATAPFLYKFFKNIKS